MYTMALGQLRQRRNEPGHIWAQHKHRSVRKGKNVIHKNSCPTLFFGIIESQPDNIILL